MGSQRWPSVPPMWIAFSDDPATLSECAIFRPGCGGALQPRDNRTSSRSVANFSRLGRRRGWRQWRWSSPPCVSPVVVVAPRLTVRGGRWSQAVEENMHEDMGPEHGAGRRQFASRLVAAHIRDPGGSRVEGRFLGDLDGHPPESRVVVGGCQHEFPRPLWRQRRGRRRGS